jgi:hypothetical protein
MARVARKGELYRAKMRRPFSPFLPFFNRNFQIAILRLHAGLKTVKNATPTPCTNTANGNVQRTSLRWI